MSRQLEQAREERRAKRNKQIVAAVEYELASSVERAGGILTGFSVKLGAVDTLLTLRLVLAGRDQVSYVGAADLGTCLIKAVRLASSDQLSYRDSKF